MRREDVSRWLERYVAAWKSGDRGEIEALFGDDARYRYHPYDEPLVGPARECPETPGQPCLTLKRWPTSVRGYDSLRTVG